MYSEDDLFVFDEFFSIDYIAGHLRHLVSSHSLVDAVQKLRALAANTNSDPVEVMKAVSNLQAVIGPYLLKAALASDVWWDSWCRLHPGYFQRDKKSPVDGGRVCWSGKHGSVYTRQIGKEPDEPLVMHVIKKEDEK